MSVELERLMPLIVRTIIINIARTDINAKAMPAVIKNDFINDLISRRMETLMLEEQNAVE